MPIHICDYVWHQTAEKVVVSLDLHHTSPKNVDVVTTSSYLKVNFLPYIFEGFLSGQVDTERSRARAVAGRLELELVKKVADETWAAACLQLTPEEKRVRRQQAGEELQELESMRAKKKKDEQIGRERHAIAHQISTDDWAREERKKAIEDLKKEFLAKTEISDGHESKDDGGKDDDDDDERKNDDGNNDDGGGNNETNGEGDDENKSVKGKGREAREERRVDDEDERANEEFVEAVKQLEMHNTRETSQEKSTEEAMTGLRPHRRRRWSSAGSEDSGGGGVMAGDHDYDGDGEDSIHYSSSENLCHLQGKGRTEALNRSRKKSSLNRKEKEEKEKKGEREKKGDRERKGDREKEEKQRRGDNEETKRKGRKKLPGVRQNGSIYISHTPRVFPTPSRESTQDDEQQWLATQSVVGSGDKAVNDSTTPILEHFRKKAVFLFKNGDYHGCVNACTEALTLSPSAPAFYSNRAAAGIALGNLHHAITDCSKALELLTPGTTDNLKSRLLCHVRRGTALVRLGLVSEGLADYEVALSLAPDDTSLQRDVARLRSLLMDTEDESDSGCEDIRKRIV